MSKRPPPTRKQLLAMMARSSWEQKVALCVIILLNRDPAQNEDNRQVAVDILQQMGRLLDVRGHWLHGLSSEVKASIDGCLIHDHRG